MSDDDGLTGRDGRLTDLAIERYVLGELTQEQVVALETHLLEVPADAERVAFVQGATTEQQTEDLPEWTTTLHIRHDEVMALAEAERAWEADRAKQRQQEQLVRTLLIVAGALGVALLASMLT